MPLPHGRAKLDDCRRHGSGSGAELFVVEGDSAAAAVSGVRDPAFQAVLPMQGKPLNALRAGAAKVQSHSLFAALIDALGTGFDSRFDAAGLRYDRILLLMDPDADGIHCGVLMLMFFHRWMRPLLDAGRIEIVRPPWGEIRVAGEASPRHAGSEAELQAMAARCAAQGGVVARRFRGLAAIDTGTLQATCVVPATRRTETVTAPAVEAMIEMLGAGM